jgi:superfamily II DNA/RNA helicase
MLNSNGFKSAPFHSDLKQNVRERIMREFKNGDIQILVATDIAARGIDVKNIDAVINFDSPRANEMYVHRIGRTGRAEATGHAYTFIEGNINYVLKELQKVSKGIIVEHIIEGLEEFEVVDEMKYENNNRGERKPFESKPQRVTAEDKQRLFVNIGSKDGLDNDSFRKYLLDNTSLEPSDIDDV